MEAGNSRATETRGLRLFLNGGFQIVLEASLKEYERAHRVALETNQFIEVEGENGHFLFNPRQVVNGEVLSESEFTATL